MNELLTNAQMAEADRLAVKLGVPSLTLMENAGRAVASEAIKMVDAGARIVVLCGPGNNGGDGFVAARLLDERGYDVAVYLYGGVDRLKGDAADMARRWVLPVEVMECLPDPTHVGDHPVLPETAMPTVLREADLVVDALLGAGLDRPLTGAIQSWVVAVNSLSASRRALPVLSIDVPTGLNGTSGEVAGGIGPGSVIWATRTITFFRMKPGHVLYPGRDLCGEVVLADIGIPETVLDRGGNAGQVADEAAIRPEIELNDGRCAEQAAGQKHSIKHKYDYGHALVLSGPSNATGAARLAARAALRVGAGLVTLLSPSEALAENAAHLTAVMLTRCDGAEDLAHRLADVRINAVLLGPGAGVGQRTRDMVFASLAAHHAGIVLDADALTSFADPTDRQELFKAIAARNDETLGPGTANVVLTPHEGEFRRLFPDVTGSKVHRARQAALMSGAVILLKGPDTVIASPQMDGFITAAGQRGTLDSAAIRINTNAPPWLATAGSGDVLAGFVAGLLAQGMPAFDATSAAVWMHGECANRYGPGLIAEDLTEMLPGVLKTLYDAGNRSSPRT